MRLARLTSIVAGFTSLGLVACGDSGGGPGGGTIDPKGTHTQYVMNKVGIPANANEASQFALDIDGNGQPDNALGSLLGSLAGAAGLDIAGQVDTSVAQGQIIVLADLQATSLSAATGVGLRVYLGENPMPAACTDANDTVCGHHLDGSGTFDVSASSPTDAVVVGSVVGGGLTAGPGTVGLQLPLSATSAPINITLVGARVETDVSATGLMNGKLGGAVTAAQIDSEVLPAVQQLMADLIARDCTMPAPNCCVDGSTGASILGFFDTNSDCMVPLDELKMNDLISSTLENPDLDLFDGSGKFNPRQDGTKDSLSLAVSFTGVNGTFTAP